VSVNYCNFPLTLGVGFYRVHRDQKEEKKSATAANVVKRRRQFLVYLISSDQL